MKAATSDANRIDTRCSAEALAHHQATTFEVGECSYVRADGSLQGTPPGVIAPFSPKRKQTTEHTPPQAPRKLKSIVCVPLTCSATDPGSHAAGATQAPGIDDSQEWQLVKSKRGNKTRPSLSSAMELHRSPYRPTIGVIRAGLPDNFKTSGHIARFCKTPTHWRPVHSRLGPLPPKPPIHTRLTFPPNSIHSRITFPPLPSVPPSLPAAGDTMAYIAGRPHQRPAQGSAAVVSTTAMSFEVSKLERQGMTLLVRGSGYYPRPEEVAYALHDQLCIPLFNIRATRHQPQDFFVHFDHPNQQQLVVRRGSIDIGGSRLDIQPWRHDPVNPHTMWYRVKIIIERLPLHAWSEEAFRQILGDICIFDRMQEASFTQTATDLFECWAWMWNPYWMSTQEANCAASTHCFRTSDFHNPDLLPRSKLTFFFNENPGKVPRPWGLPQPVTVAAPPVGDLIELIIHLPCYENWRLTTSPSPSSEGLGLPSSSSTPGAQSPDFQEFIWHSGVRDGREPVRRSRQDQGCRDPSIVWLHRDHEPDEDGHRNNDRRDWRMDINARGRPTEDDPRGQSDRRRTGSPRHRRHQDNDGTVMDEVGRGRSASRQAERRSRERDPLPRKTKEWDRRCSCSPAREGGRPQASDDGGMPVPSAVAVPSHAAEQVHETLMGCRPPSPQRLQLPDPLMDFFGKVCSSPLQVDAYHFRTEFDPMIHEFESFSNSLANGISSPYYGSPQWPNLSALPAHVPVSADWQGADDYLSRATLPQPARPRPAPKPAAKTPKRSSLRLTKRPTTVPVSMRATHRLIRELDLASVNEQITDEVVAEYLKMYQKPLKQKEIDALSRVTHLNNVQI
ncbi:hypothetical protein QOZ80_6BG0495200 [Eleusine coracana subsp. coracana]|nr:hypothetical protein QOZ80_6BG0495200 [Eleusine coracana subsp. coracana]